MIKSLPHRFCITNPAANERALAVMKLEADLKSFGMSDKAIEKMRELAKELAYTTPATVQTWHQCLGRRILHNLWRRTVGLDSPHE